MPGPLDALKKATSIGRNPNVRETGAWDKALEMLTGYPFDPTREVGPEDALGVMGAAGPFFKMGKSISLAALREALDSGLAERLMKTVSSSRLKALNVPYEYGSIDTALAATGFRSATSPTVKDIPHDMLTSIDYGARSGGISSVPRHEAELARRELYRISQQAMDEFGVGPEDAVELYRRGAIPKNPHILTPTTVDENIAQQWGARSWGPPSSLNSFDVPRRSIAALVGLLRRGDDLTTSEALVPAHELVKHARGTITPDMLRDPNLLLKGDFTRIPSWAKRPLGKP